jgi:hypothetical protein
VGKSATKFVGPGETFQTFLGVDPSIKIEYVGPKTTTSTGTFSRRVQII